MKTKVAAATAMLLLAITASAQITKNRKYDWGWSYKLEMPETGLKCEFPEKPKVTTLAYGYMTSATYKDELFVAAKLENPNPYDIACRTDELIAELKRIHGLPITDLVWGEIQSENGNLTMAGDAKGRWAQFHIDAIATEDVLTVFIYSHHDELTVPGHFFANSYSVFDIPTGNLSYSFKENTPEHANVLEHGNGRNLVRLENSPITLEWPAIPTLEVNRHQSAYSLEKNGSHYSTRIIHAEPQVSYAFFNTFIDKEQEKLRSEVIELTSDETEVAFDLGMNNETFFRKLSYKTKHGIAQQFYVAAGNSIIVQELSCKNLSAAEKRFLNTFELSVRNQYDTRTFVSK